jgi:REP element-mobilizing transposase RayT
MKLDGDEKGGRFGHACEDGLGSAQPARRCAGASRALSGASPQSSFEIHYSKRRLPHFERPWEQYAVSFATYRRRHLSAVERNLLLQSILYAHDRRQYELYAACVMPDHVHLLFESQIKRQDHRGRTVFWSLTQILHGVKSASGHRINKAAGAEGPVWEKESFDRLIRSEADLQEKVRYICRNPWNTGVAPASGDYPWLLTQEMPSAGAPKTARGTRALPDQ